MNQEWPWSPELDGVVAAPDHHRVIFENDEVRVLETAIPAGDTTPVHTHRRATAMYVVSGSHFLRRDENGEVMLDTRAQEPPFEMPPVIWSDGTPAHTLENTGTDDLDIGVELKR
ncbi:MAG: cytoplasmic protein [Actinomycetota bacterium]|nr:cytoplasmic protein [Actinomycetota bacterium]